MRKKRVVLLVNRSLLVAGMLSLLKEIDDLEVIAVAAGDPEASSTIRRFAPRVIVLDAGDTSLGEGVISGILGQNPKARVVALNLNSRDIEVYRMERLAEPSPDRLVEAILGKDSPASRRLRRRTGEEMAERREVGQCDIQPST